LFGGFPGFEIGEGGLFGIRAVFGELLNENEAALVFELDAVGFRAAEIGEGLDEAFGFLFGGIHS